MMILMQTSRRVKLSNGTKKNLKGENLLRVAEPPAPAPAPAPAS